MYMIEKAKLSIRAAIMSLTAALCRIFGPKFAARITARSIRLVPGRSGINFLVMMRPSMDKDIAALSQHTDLGFVIVQNGYVRFQEIFLPRDRREQTYYQFARTTFSGADDPQAIFAAELLKQAGRIAPISGVLSANIDYWQDVGLKYQCRENKLVFGVLCRENAVIPKIVRQNYDRYRNSGYHFDGDFVVMAGQTSAKMFRDAGVAPADRIYSSGLPRYDVWHSRGEERKRNYITLLTFTRGYGADQTFQEVLDVFIRSAASCLYNDIVFLIKTKDAADTRQLSDMLRGRLTSNVMIDDQIPMVEALSGSRMIVGYNSLSLIDALLSGTNIILPAWGECQAVGDMCMYPRNSISEKFFDFAGSASAMEKALRDVLIEDRKNMVPEPEVLPYIQDYVTYDPRVLNSIAFAEIAKEYVKIKQETGQ